MSIGQKSQKAYLLTGRAFDYLEVSKQPMEPSMSRISDKTLACENENTFAAVADQDRRVELVPLAQLTPYKGNARTHGRKQIRQIADSIKQFGFTNPVLIDDTGAISPVMVASKPRVARSERYPGIAFVPFVRR